MNQEYKNIIITGFMGTGKTTVGEEVARRLNRKFYDTDRMIESQNNLSILDIFNKFGEAHFRELERNIFQRLLTTTKDAVIATGGGTLLFLKNGEKSLNSSIIFCLSSRSEILIKRLTRSSSRPLLQKEELEENISTLLKKREKEYHKMGHQIDTSDISPVQVAKKIIRIYRLAVGSDCESTAKLKVEINPQSHSYTIEIKAEIIKEAGRLIKKSSSPGKVVVLTNDLVYSLYYQELKGSLDQSRLDNQVIIVPDGERYKSLKTCHYIINQLIEYRADRSSVLITLGGGVICDLGGFVAATYMRGIPLVHIPTTLVAQIDASIGGKTAADHPRAKNLIGAFYQPRLVLCDPEVLKTLRRKDLLNGLFEAIKIALVCDKELFFFIADNQNGILKRDQDILRPLIVRCIREKVQIVEKDPLDENLRAILNFGHTFAHALETNGKYRSISHGQAVGLGMLLAFRLSNILGHLPERKTKEAYELIARLVKFDMLKKMDPRETWDTMALDKKAKQGKVRFVLLQDIGKPVIEEVSRKVFFKALERL